jgi:hypothetical protein
MLEVVPHIDVWRPKIKGNKPAGSLRALTPRSLQTLNIKSNFTVFRASACIAALQGEPFKCGEVS